LQKKLFLSLTAPMCMVLIVTSGCGGQSKSSNGDSKTQTPSASSTAAAAATGKSSDTGSAQKVTINFAGMKTFGEDSWTELVNQFEKENPTIDVKVNQLPAPSESTAIHQYLVTSLSSGQNDVDVFTGDVIWVPEFAAAGWTEPMDSYIPDKDKYYPGVIDALTYNKQLMAVPWYVDGGMLFYRKDLLEKYNQPVPKTWDELTKTATLIQGKENNAKLQGFMWQAKQAEVLVCDFMEFLTSANGAVLDKNEKTVINSPEAAKALKFMKDSITSGLSPNSVLSSDEEPSRTVFTDGNAIFLRNWSYTWNVSQDEKSSKIAGKVGVAPLPSFDGGKSASTMGGYQFMVAKNSKNKEAAVKFANFLSSEKSQLYFAKKLAFSPTRPAVLADEDLKKSVPLLSNLDNVFRGTVARPISPKYPQISLKLQANISAVLANKMSIDQALVDLDKQINGLLK
jgi:multiple sugar transport system substrate-binding protein